MKNTPEKPPGSPKKRRRAKPVVHVVTRHVKTGRNSLGYIMPERWEAVIDRDKTRLHIPFHIQAGIGMSRAEAVHNVRSKLASAGVTGWRRVQSIAA